MPFEADVRRLGKHRLPASSSLPAFYAKAPASCYKHGNYRLVPSSALVIERLDASHPSEVVRLRRPRKGTQKRTRCCGDSVAASGLEPGVSGLFSRRFPSRCGIDDPPGGPDALPAESLQNVDLSTILFCRTVKSRSRARNFSGGTRLSCTGWCVRCANVARPDGNARP